MHGIKWTTIPVLSGVEASCWRKWKARIQPIVSREQKPMSGPEFIVQTSTGPGPSPFFFDRSQLINFLRILFLLCLGLLPCLTGCSLARPRPDHPWAEFSQEDQKAIRELRGHLAEPAVET